MKMRKRDNRREIKWVQFNQKAFRSEQFEMPATACLFLTRWKIAPNQQHSTIVPYKRLCCTNSQAPTPTTKIFECCWINNIVSLTFSLCHSHSLSLESCDSALALSIRCQSFFEKRKYYRFALSSSMRLALISTNAFASTYTCTQERGAFSKSSSTAQYIQTVQKQKHLMLRENFSPKPLFCILHCVSFPSISLFELVCVYTCVRCVCFYFFFRFVASSKAQQKFLCMPAEKSDDNNISGRVFGRIGVLLTLFRRFFAKIQRIKWKLWKIYQSYRWI